MIRSTIAKTAALVISITGLAVASPAFAAPGSHMQQDQYIGNYCTSYPSDHQCSDWRSNHSHWSSNQYHSFYMDHERSAGFGGDFAAGLFGFAVGATIAAAANNSGDYDSHVAACENYYRSYDVNSNTYLGYDGIRHQCML